MLSRITRKFKSKKRTQRFLLGIFMVLFFVITVFGIAFSADVTFAQTTEDSVNTDTFLLSDLSNEENGLVLGKGDIRIVIAKIIRAVFALLGIIFIVLVLYAGYTIMLSGGDETKVSKGKLILRNAVIGLLIMLSAFTITQFIINALADATGSGGRSGSSTNSRPGFDTFSGSGSLGNIIRDHYPFRSQTDVARNTKIVVTFSEPIDPSSIIENTNQTCWPSQGEIPGSLNNPDSCAKDQNNNPIPYFGDCLAPPEGETFDWQRECDHLIVERVQISPKDDDQRISSAAALTIYEGEAQENLNFVFRPFEPLGSSIEPVNYKVRLTNDILKKDGVTGVFSNSRSAFYQWEFQTGTTLDVSAPVVEVTYPRQNQDQPVPKNSLIQINFSEAMDPISVAGLLNPNSIFTNIPITSRQPGTPQVGGLTISGEWKATNAYKTVEFVPDNICGQNSCGDTVYCLDLDCDPNDPRCTNIFTVLARSANLLGGEQSNPFEAAPFTGITDISGNALDGNADEIADGKPLTGENLHEITKRDEIIINDIVLQPVNELTVDNYFWEFEVANIKDISAPYVRQVIPGIDQEDINHREPVNITFSHPMWNFSLYSININEFPQNQNIDELWTRTRTINDNNRTVAILDHREFGPNNVDAYYFPTVPTNVKSITQNCLYPGRGPVANEGVKNTSPICNYEVDENNIPRPDPNNGADCVNVTFDENSDTGCVQTTDQGAFSLTQPSIEECLNILEQEEISQIE